MSQPEARRDSLDDHFFTTALGWGLDDESERLTGAFDQLAPALDGADQGSRSRAHPANGPKVKFSPAERRTQYGR